MLKPEIDKVYIRPLSEEVTLTVKRYDDIGKMQDLCGRPRLKDIRTKGA